MAQIIEVQGEQGPLILTADEKASLKTWVESLSSDLTISEIQEMMIGRQGDNILVRFITRKKLPIEQLAPGVVVTGVAEEEPV